MPPSAPPATPTVRPAASASSAPSPVTIRPALLTHPGPSGAPVSASHAFTPRESTTAHTAFPSGVNAGHRHGSGVRSSSRVGPAGFHHPSPRPVLVNATAPDP